MAPKKYPLDPLRKVRDAAVDRASRALGDAVRDREGAERRKRSAEQEARRAEEEAQAIAEAERAKLERGELRVADLARADAWAVAASAEKERLAHQVKVADDTLRGARGAERAAQADVAGRKADADVVEKDRAKWKAAQERAAEARAEEEAAEVWRQKR